MSGKGLEFVQKDPQPEKYPLTVYTFVFLITKLLDSILWPEWQSCA